jgi:hypothetical protein
MVAEHLIGNDNYDSFAIRRWGEDTWDAIFETDQGSGPMYGSGLCPSIPEAICKAALRSKGYEIELE